MTTGGENSSNGNEYQYRCYESELNDRDLALTALIDLKSSKSQDLEDDLTNDMYLHEGPGARAHRLGHQAGMAVNDIKANVDQALNFVIFPGMSSIPLRDHRRKFEEQYANANTLEQRNQAFIDRANYFNDLGALDLGKFSWIHDLVDFPHYSVYILPDSDFLYMFTCGVGLHHPHLPDLCLLMPTVWTNGSNIPSSSLVLKYGRLMNHLVRSMLNGNCIPREDITIPQSYDDEKEMYWINYFQFESSITEKHDVARIIHPTTIATVESRYPDYKKYQTFGKDILNERPMNVFFNMTDSEVHGFLGMLYWLTYNWEDRHETKCIGIKLPNLNMT